MTAEKLLQQIRSYDSFHQSMANRRLHYCGIPLFLIAILGLLSRYSFAAPLFGAELRLDGGMILLGTACAWYAILDWKTALAAGAAGIGCYTIGAAAPLYLLWILVVFAVVSHLIGHIVFERNFPAFLSYPGHVLAAPLWILSLWTKSLREIR